MNLKSKLFGFGAAAVLSLSVMSGAMANHEVKSTAELKAGPACHFSSGGTLATDFGIWTWDGLGEYEAPTNNSATLKATMKSAGPEGCDVTASASNLEGDQGGEISRSYLSVSDDNARGVGTSTSLASDQTRNYAPGETTWTFTLNDVPDNLPADEYEGKINITIQNAS